MGDTTDPLGGTCGPSSPTHDPSPPLPTPPPPAPFIYRTHISLDLLYSSTYTYNLHSCTLAEFNGGRQRGLNDLLRGRLSCRHMIRLHANPFPSSHVSRLSLFLIFSVCRKSTFLTEEEGERVVVEPNHTITRMPGPL